MELDYKRRLDEIRPHFHALVIPVAMRAKREIGWELGEYINTVLYTVDDWAKNSFTPFHKNVEAEAIAL